MKQIVVAGATGYLGRYLVQALQKRAFPFRALARNRKKLSEMLNLQPKEIIQAEVTRPETMKGKLEGAQIIISTVGITRQKDGLTYMDVDYQANLNLLNEAIKAGVQKFIYISAINGDKMRHLKILAAKEKFVDTLKNSGLDYLIVRPNGFFSDMKDFLDMAKTGKVYLFGKGNYKLNPIHGTDLADAILDRIDGQEKELIAGGPDMLSQNQIAELALKAQGKSGKIIHLPDWIRKTMIYLLRAFTSVKTYGPYEFFLTMMSRDNVAPCFGDHHLETFFTRAVGNNKGALEKAD